MSFLDQELCSFLLKKAGLSLNPRGQVLIEERLKDLAAPYGLTSGEDLSRQAVTSPPFMDKLLSAVTIHETLWFRDQHPFRNILQLLSEKKTQPLNVWSAACSTGQEPYSLKITQLEEFPELKLNILGTDICQDSVSQSKKGTYDNFSMSRGMTPELRKKYFKNQDQEWTIQQEAKAGISFQHLNLKETFSNLPKFNLIFLRNVIIYFPMDVKKDLIQRLLNHLEPGGLLLLGGCESIVGFSSQLKMKSLNGTLYYEHTPS